MYSCIIRVLLYRHIIQYTKDCFYNAETWQECNLDLFITQAQASAIDSLKNVYDPMNGRLHRCALRFSVDNVSGGACL